MFPAAIENPVTDKPAYVTTAASKGDALGLLSLYAGILRRRNLTHKLGVKLIPPSHGRRGWAIYVSPHDYH